jgi:hypothetical protein
MGALSSPTMMRRNFMTLFETYQQIYTPHAIVGTRRGPSLMNRFIRGVQWGWRAHLRYKRLAKLSDEALRARGLSRRQLARRVFVDED